ncbi:MAG TPA: enoyl-CoA hydratase/isomerase family protein [Candidatus Acidoferrales bacterium]|nr:enoyl-CoA hydratase/isomerase family protein [Candidatus Acidoferrales bacterium]
MKPFRGEALSWELTDGIVEVTLHRPPCNEIGAATLDDLEHLARALGGLKGEAAAMVLASGVEAGFSAGADLRELYTRMQGLEPAARVAGVRDFLERMHRALNCIDAAELVTIAAVERVCFGGGLELALACDLIIAGRTARFCFPELRLGLIPGFGGIPRLKRDLGNGVVRDMLFTGRSINADRAREAGLASQVVGEGQALRAARQTAAQARKFDWRTVEAAKRFLKPVPYAELRQEIELFTELFNRPAVEENLRKFVESSDVLPYLP